MKRLIFFILLASFYTVQAQDLAWKKQFIEKYQELNLLSEVSLDSLGVLYDQNLLDERAKATTYSYYLNRDDYGALPSDLKMLMLIHFIELDQEHPDDLLYKKGKTIYVQEGGEYLEMLLAEGMSSSGDSQAYLAKKIETLKKSYMKKGIDVPFYKKVVDSFTKPNRLD